MTDRFCDPFHFIEPKFIGFLLFQVRSRSLTHLDNLDPSLLKCPGTGSSENEMLKDSYSEPDCTMAIGSTPSAEQILAVPTYSGDVYTASGRQVYSHSKGPTSLEASNNRRHMMIRSQVIINSKKKY